MLEIIGDAIKVQKRENWNGLRTFPWRKFDCIIEELLPFTT